MPFTCAICSLDIQVGEPMLSDDRMNLAHKACVDRLVQDPAHPSISIPSVYLVPPPPPAPPPSPSVAPDSCVPSSRVRFCSECGKPCISMCPAPCLMYVHQSYGYDGGPACSSLHEGRCEVARRSREPEPKPPPGSVAVALQVDPYGVAGAAITKARRNGTHKHRPVAKKKGRARR